MGYHQDYVREEMERAADIGRGLGMSYGLGPADMAYYSERMSYAALADSRADMDAWYEEEAETYRKLNEELHGDKS